MTHTSGTTTEALMTDPTTPEGVTYWQDRHDDEKRMELTARDVALRVLAERAMLAEWLRLASERVAASPASHIGRLLDALERAGIRLCS